MNLAEQQIMINAKLSNQMITTKFIAIKESARIGYIAQAKNKSNDIYKKKPT
jgi:hypothetical protein